ncbi:MAG TPA: hypothetical protein VG032_09340 [Acidimicrobiales bacterium]|nr:hypothetical protein [Acidimicrobiales bacterium]
MRFAVTIAALCVSMAVAGCSLHVSKHGVNGNIFGHSFSASKGSLPTGFPSDVPTPDASRVLGGGGADKGWDAAFAVTGTITAGTMAYVAKLRTAGYSISNFQSGTTPVTGTTGSGSTATTVTLTGATFQATDPQWTMQVASGSTSSITGTGLKAGEFAINVTIIPTTSTSQPS